MTTSNGVPKRELRDVERTLVQAVMFEAGIVPMEKTGLDMRRALNQLDPTEARQLKRRFRKLWRKAAARAVAQGSMSEDASKGKLGLGKKVPSRAERNARKQLVFDEMWNAIIGPMVKKFDNAGKDVPVETTGTKRKKAHKPA